MARKRMTELDLLDRPREKIARNGPECLSDEELISAILGRGIQGRDVITLSREVAGLLRSESRIGYPDLIGIDGIGPSKASLLLACFELSRRYGHTREADVIQVTTPEDLLSIPGIRDLRTKKQEHFLVVTLNGASEVITSRTVTMGLLNHSLVHPREVFADAITDRAAAIIGVHNHPSGNPSPSRQDIEITGQLAAAGAILGIHLLDHVIITRDAIISLREQGHLPG